MSLEKEKPSLDGDGDIFLKVQSDALRLLSFRPRSTSELTKRLKIKKYPTEVIDKVIAALTKNGLLDDKKFAKLFVNSQVHARPTGKRQLAFDLKKTGLSEDVVADAMAELSEYDEKKTAKELVENRFARLTGVSDVKKKARAFGFLKRRGFSSGVVYAVLNEVFSGAKMNVMDEGESNDES